MNLEIRSTQNERVKHVVRLLRDGSARRDADLAVVEGAREVERAMESGWAPSEIYIDVARANERGQTRALEAERTGTRLFRCSSAVFDKMAYRENPDGIFAVGPAPGSGLEDLALPAHPLILVAEEVEKPGNLGALLRTADGAGADAVIVCDPAADLGNPNLIRSSIGTVFYLPVAKAASEDAARWLKARGIRIVTAEPAADLVYTDYDLAGSVALVVGAEDAGVSPVWRREADVRVCIPMLGRNDSLNVSVAAAVVLYEAARQRMAARR
jgi:TrmH family RNA methyltransferase